MKMLKKRILLQKRYFPNYALQNCQTPFNYSVHCNLCKHNYLCSVAYSKQVCKVLFCLLPNVHWLMSKRKKNFLESNSNSIQLFHKLNITANKHIPIRQHYMHQTFPNKVRLLYSIHLNLIQKTIHFIRAIVYHLPTKTYLPISKQNYL